MIIQQKILKFRDIYFKNFISVLHSIDLFAPISSTRSGTAARIREQDHFSLETLFMLAIFSCMIHNFKLIKFPHHHHTHTHTHLPTTLLQQPQPLSLSSSCLSSAPLHTVSALPQPVPQKNRYACSTVVPDRSLSRAAAQKPPRPGYG